MSLQVLPCDNETRYATGQSTQSWVSRGVPFEGSQRNAQVFSGVFRWGGPRGRLKLDSLQRYLILRACENPDFQIVHSCRQGHQGLQEHVITFRRQQKPAVLERSLT